MEKTKRFELKHILVLLIVFVSIILGLAVCMRNRENAYVQATENNYNQAFYELVSYVQNVESYLAKSMISTTPEHGAETLTHVWREANLAQTYLAQLPLGNDELSNTAKFLNQVSDYSYSLSRKNIYNEELTQEELDNLKTLHDYSVELENTLNQLSNEMFEGTLTWSELTKEKDINLAQQVSNISQDSFGSLEENFHEYAGLIYDGAFSEHITSVEKKGLTGDDIDEGKAKQIAEDFIGNDKINEITSNGFSENADIPSYDFYIRTKNDVDVTISISKKGGHIILMNSNRDVEAEVITMEQANEKGKEFLNTHGFTDMKETYYLKEGGIVTINYAYFKNDVTAYPDLIKLKVALDNGEILGIETTGYLNSHTERILNAPKISKEEAKENLNKNIELQSEGLAIIPTEWKTELLCWEFKGKVDDTDFLVYINAETGREEDILIIVNTPNGTLTM
ncbi:MAG: germination protein YpeB [Clostridia bacterium]|nr:germination protein YpeB [Clostridia bacterium]